jgi:putative transposase
LPTIFGQQLRTILASTRPTTTDSGHIAADRLRLPRPDHPPADLSQERIKRRPAFGGGNINEYERAA